MGEEEPGGGAGSITGSAQGPNAVGASANSPGVTRWLPLKGRIAEGGGQGRAWDLFSVGGHLRGKVPGLGLCVGDRWELGGGVTGPRSYSGKATSRHTGGRRGASWGWHCARGPWEASLPSPVNLLGRGTLPPSIPGHRSCVPLRRFPRAPIQKSHQLRVVSFFF